MSTGAASHRATGAPRERRRLAVLASVAAILCVGLSSASPAEAYGPAALRQRMGFALVELGRLAGLRTDDGPPRQLPVTLVQEGGPLWMQGGLSAALAHDAVFGPAGTDPASMHLVHVEVVSLGSRHAVRVALHRMAWSLASPDPFVLQLSPWIAALSGVLGALLCAGTRASAGIVRGLVLAGVLAQGLSFVGPWPPPRGRPPVLAVWQDGWLGAAIERLATALPESATAFGAGLVALSAVLIYFDHKRSHERGVVFLLRGLVGVAAVLAWIEAALRVGAGGFVTTGVGLACAVALAVAWSLAIRLVRAER